ncbi:3-phosphoshikimate 1-carboxyvinyltransferase [Clostridium rectalis]|uniref:3-phosphoshikimate 1-carboxyvinyltransferase n=1 Tax=Clostridium rectalis TaxID=2040295 RepID=UPI001FA96192|nr:3-phosphoshikimate 1-carboxyvinyltransferase [Clostridium rectalis]
MNTNSIIIKSAGGLVKKNYSMLGDKSIAHRAILLGALGSGEYKVKNFPNNKDCSTTLNCMMQLGVDIKKIGNTLYISSPGYSNFNKKIYSLNGENSGTTVRLISGILAALGIETKIIGDESLSGRPMGRIVEPLELMGGKIKMEDNHLPLYFHNNSGMHGINYHMKVASAQVKSCILMAGFLSKGVTKVIENMYTRDHTERMFKFLGADIKIIDKEIVIRNSKLQCKDIFIPGDISSAAYLIACCILGTGCTITITDVLLNERRRKYIDILKSMGAKIKYNTTKILNEEKVGDIVVCSGILKGTSIDKNIIPYIIDEIPILSLLAAFAKGVTIFKGVEELKYKESNRIEAIIYNLNNMGVKTKFDGEDLIIYGEKKYIDKNIYIKTFNDHRIALTFLCAAVRSKETVFIDNWACTDISFPNAINYFKDFIRII